jgi:hypothetical protein
MRLRGLKLTIDGEKKTQLGTNIGQVKDRRIQGTQEGIGIMTSDKIVAERPIQNVVAVI